MKGFLFLKQQGTFIANYPIFVKKKKRKCSHGDQNQVKDDVQIYSPVQTIAVFDLPLQ